MPQPIPLTTSLRIKLQYIIIDHSSLRPSPHDLVSQSAPPKARPRRFIQRPIERNAFSRTDLRASGRGDSGWREKIQSAFLVGGAEATPSVVGWSVGEEGEGGEGDGAGVHYPKFFLIKKKRGGSESLLVEWEVFRDQRLNTVKLEESDLPYQDIPEVLKLNVT